MVERDAALEELAATRKRIVELEKFAACADEARRAATRERNAFGARLKELTADRDSEERWANEYLARAEAAEVEARDVLAELRIVTSERDKALADAAEAKARAHEEAHRQLIQLRDDLTQVGQVAGLDSATGDFLFKLNRIIDEKYGTVAISGD